MYLLERLAENALQLERDKMRYGVRFVDARGWRIDPADVRSLGDPTTALGSSTPVIGREPVSGAGARVLRAVR